MIYGSSAPDLEGLLLETETVPGKVQGFSGPAFQLLTPPVSMAWKEQQKPCLKEVTQHISRHPRM